MKEKREQVKNWWSNNKDKIVKLGLAGSLLYMAGYINATKKVMEHDRVIMEDHRDDDIEIIDF